MTSRNPYEPEQRKPTMRQTMSRIFDEIEAREATKARENPAPDYSGLSLEDTLGAVYDDIQARAAQAARERPQEPEFSWFGYRTKPAAGRPGAAARNMFGADQEQPWYPAGEAPQNSTDDRLALSVGMDGNSVGTGHEPVKPWDGLFPDWESPLSEEFRWNIHQLESDRDG